MKHEISVNKFSAEFWSDGYPRWTSIKYDGAEIVRVHHQEVKDLEYCLSRIRDELRRVSNEKEQLEC